MVIRVTCAMPLRVQKCQVDEEIFISAVRQGGLRQSAGGMTTFMILVVIAEVSSTRTGTPMPR